MRGRLSVIVLFCSILSAGLPASASLYIVPLDGLRGVYSTGDLGPSGKTVSFDFGRQFQRIDGVRLWTRGTVAPSLWRMGQGDDFDPFPDTFSACPPLVFSVQPEDATGGANVSLLEGGAFDAELTFTGWTNPQGETPDWSFLQNGRGTLVLELGWQVAFADAIQIVPGLAGISEASLIVEGQAVPEPATTTMLIVMLSAVMIRRDRRS